MPAQFTISNRDVDDIIAEMKRVSAAIRASLDALEANAERSLQSWTGSAQGAYHAAKASWDASAARMPALLDTAGNALDAINFDYFTTDRLNADEWQGIVNVGGR